MTKFMEKKIENLNAINNWCKELMKGKDEMLICKKAFECNDHLCTVIVSDDGIVVGNGIATYSVKPIDYDGRNLIMIDEGSELVYQWKYVKCKIENEYQKMLRNEEIMMNFVL